MDWLVWLILVVVVAVVLAARLKPQGVKGFPYKKNPVLFSPAERSFLGVLEQAVGDQYRVFGKVRVADVANVKSMSDCRTWQRAFNKISAKHFDFVICASDNLEIVAAVELDDKSHGKRQRQDRDKFLAGLCEAISLPLVRVPAQRAYSLADLQVLVGAALAQGKAGSDAPLEPTYDPEVEPLPGVSAEHHGRRDAADVAFPACPKCAAPMVRRHVKAGDNAGREFWGCSAFPKCRGIRHDGDDNVVAADAGTYPKES